MASKVPDWAFVNSTVRIVVSPKN